MGKKNRNMSSKKKEEVAVTITDIDALLEKLLEKSIEQIFILAVEKLVIHSKYPLSFAISTILSCGRISGKKTDLLWNILENTLSITENNYNSKLKSNFTSIAKLARFSMDGLIDIILKHESKPTKKDVIIFLLCSDYLLIEDDYINNLYLDNINLDNIDLDDNMEKPKTGAPCLNIDLKEILKQLPWLDLEPLLPNTGERSSSQFDDFKAIIQSVNNAKNLQNIYDACKKIIVEDKVILEKRIGKRQREFKREFELEKLKGKLADIDEKKGQLYALFMTQERLYQIEKYNQKHAIEYKWKIEFKMEKKKYMNELRKLENQLSQPEA